MPSPLKVSQSPSLKVSKSPTHGGARPGAGRDPAPYTRKNVTLELPQPLIDAWDTYATKHHLSRPKALAKLLKWKWPR